MPRPRKPASPFRYFNSSPEVIRLVVLMYVRFPLSLRNVEERIGQIEVELDDLLAVREADVEKESTGPAPLGEQVRTARVAAAQRAVRMIEEAGEARVSWLRAIAASVDVPTAAILGESAVSSGERQRGLTVKLGLFD